MTHKTNTQLAQLLTDILLGYQHVDGHSPVCRFEVGGAKWLNLKDAIERLKQIGDQPAEEIGAQQVREAGEQELARWPDGPKSDCQDRCARNAVHSLCRRLGVEL